MKNSIPKIIVFLILTLLGCEKDESKTGTVSFGNNRHIVNSISHITVYVDGDRIGEIIGFTDSISDCDQIENLNIKIPVGKHVYKIEIRPDSGIGCTKELRGEFEIDENECVKIFIDYAKLNF